MMRRIIVQKLIAKDLQYQVYTHLHSRAKQFTIQEWKADFHILMYDCLNLRIIFKDTVVCIY